MKRSLRRGTLLCAVGVWTTVLGASAVEADGELPVEVYQTTGTRDFARVQSSPFTRHFYTDMQPLDVDAAEERFGYQGLGVSMTDASCWLLNEMPTERRTALLQAVFGAEGANLSFVRLNIGASDYSTALYTYDDTPGDVEMRCFSVARDDRYLFPMVREALKVNPSIRLFAAPWSVPGWMKDSGKFVVGNFKDGCEQACANYLLAYVRTCQERGFELKAVSVQNEVNLSTRGTYPSCVYTAEQEADVAKRLSAALKAGGFRTGVWIWDNNYDGATNRVMRQLEDAELRAAIGGVAWHSYDGRETDVYALRKKHPEIGFFHTEMGPSTLPDSGRTERWWCDKVFRALENGCETYTGWNLCLTPDGQPLTGPFCCGGLVTVDPGTWDFTFSEQYRVFRHIAPFVKSGAKVLKVDGAKDGTATICFRNPDGTRVLVVGSDGAGAKGTTFGQRPRLYIKYKGLMKHLPLPARTWSLTTVLFR